MEKRLSGVSVSPGLVRRLGSAGKWGTDAISREEDRAATGRAAGETRVSSRRTRGPPAATVSILSIVNSSQPEGSGAAMEPREQTGRGEGE